ncbi:glutaredoxin [Serratia phage Muldoon]|uniref:Glutaredoxin n=1 Tax=Serratia phage Muldoon TaxID=2601678 RepID=A0A5P8PH93_9CAUD|nr:glutaredoxin [Serratia phage Muldoon]QFR56025.1 glutaredoxin [Serratia phage Muldoon]
MIRVYGLPKRIENCYACKRTRQVLDALGIEYEYHEIYEMSGVISWKPGMRAVMQEARSVYGHSSVPLVYSGDTYIGSLRKLLDHLESLGYDTDI